MRINSCWYTTVPLKLQQSGNLSFFVVASSQHASHDLHAMYIGPAGRYCLVWRYSLSSSLVLKVGENDVHQPRVILLDLSSDCMLYVCMWCGRCGGGHCRNAWKPSRPLFIAARFRKTSTKTWYIIFVDGLASIRGTINTTVASIPDMRPVCLDLRYARPIHSLVASCCCVVDRPFHRNVRTYRAEKLPSASFRATLTPRSIDVNMHYPPRINFTEEENKKTRKRPTSAGARVGAACAVDLARAREFGRGSLQIKCTKNTPWRCANRGGYNSCVLGFFAKLI